jgi:hypothetical protein
MIKIKENLKFLPIPPRYSTNTEAELITVSQTKRQCQISS